MSLPCGTILTVPKDTEMEGWVDYEASMGEIEPVYAGSVYPHPNRPAGKGSRKPCKGQGRQLY